MEQHLLVGGMLPVEVLKENKLTIILNININVILVSLLKVYSIDILLRQTFSL